MFIRIRLRSGKHNIESASSAFAGARPAGEGPALKALHAKIGQQALEIDFLESALGRDGDERKAMIDDKHDFPLRRQTVLLNISRSSLYYESAGPSPTDLEIMREMDRLRRTRVVGQGDTW
jgi:hypothetical protein